MTRLAPSLLAVLLAACVGAGPTATGQDAGPAPTASASEPSATQSAIAPGPSKAPTDRAPTAVPPGATKLADADQTSEILLHEEWVYFGEKKSLHRVPRTGGAAALVDTAEVHSLAGDSSAVYWLGRGEVRALRDGAEEPIRVFALERDWFDGLVADGPLLRFGMPGGAMLAIDKNSGAPVITLGLSARGGVRVVGVDSTFTYLVALVDPGSRTWALMRANRLTGASAETLATLTGDPTNASAVPITVVVGRDAALYVASWGRGTVERWTTTGQRISTLASGLRNPRGVVLRGTFLYWCDDDGIGSVSRFGGKLRRVVSQEGVQALAIDQSELYWVTSDAVFKQTEGLR